MRGLLLVNMGGPSGPSQVEPYLRAIFRDPAILPLPGAARAVLARWIARRRTPKVRERYQKLGGASPLLEATARLAQAVHLALPDEWSVEHAFRYCEPSIDGALRALSARGVTRVTLLPLFPHYTDAMSGSIEREAQRLSGALGLELELLPSFGDQPEVLELWHGMIAAALDDAGGRARLLFVAHGVPLRNIRRGDPYAREVEHSARALAKRLPPECEWKLAYQSRVGPVAWTGPYLEEALAQWLTEPLSAAPKPLVVVPLSVLSECLETRYYLDDVAAARADHRLATLDACAGFAEALAVFTQRSTREVAA
jgi:ferrochelatase